MQKLSNLIILLILVVIANIIPLDMQIADINLSDPIIEGESDDFKLPGDISLKVMEDSLNTHLLLSSTNGIFPEKFLDNYSVKVLANNSTEITSISLEKFEHEKTINQEILLKMPSKTNLSKFLDGKKGRFIFKVIDNFTEKELKSLEISTLNSEIQNIISPPNQVLAENINSGRLTYLTRFLPNSDYTALLPISVPSDFLTNPWREVLTSMVKGIDLPYLAKASIPNSYNIRISGDEVNMFFYPSDLEPYKDNLPLVLTAISKTYLGYAKNQNLATSKLNIFSDVLFGANPDDYRTGITTGIYNPVILENNTLALSYTNDSTNKKTAKEILDDLIKLNYLFPDSNLKIIAENDREVRVEYSSNHTDDIYEKAVVKAFTHTIADRNQSLYINDQLVYADIYINFIEN